MLRATGWANALLIYKGMKRNLGSRVFTPMAPSQQNKMCSQYYCLHFPPLNSRFPLHKIFPLTYGVKILQLQKSHFSHVQSFHLYSYLVILHVLSTPLPQLPGQVSPAGMSCLLQLLSKVLWLVCLTTKHSTILKRQPFHT
jgi:hypothetical protein